MPGTRRRSKRSWKDPVISGAGDVKASGAEKGGRKAERKTVDQLVAELIRCNKPGCTCTYCRPDLDLQRLREEGLIEHHDGKDYMRYQRKLLQIFTVKFIDFVGSGGQVRGSMWIPAIYGTYRLFGPDTDELPCIKIDPLGGAELADADCRLDVADGLDIYFKFQGVEDKKPRSQRKIKECVELLWNPYTEPVHRYLCKRLDTKLGPVEVSFAIILDAVPAHVEVRILDWLLEQDTALVDGCISVGNTDIGEKGALTHLFQKPPNGSVLVRRPSEEGSGVLLPFSKNYTFVPRDSALDAYIALKLRSKTGFRWIAQKILEFSAKPGASELQIVEGKYFKLGVNVTWSPNSLISFEERTKYFASMQAARMKRLGLA